MKSYKFGRKTPKWEGPYDVVKALVGFTYVETLQANRLPREAQLMPKQ